MLHEIDLSECENVVQSLSSRCPSSVQVNPTATDAEYLYGTTSQSCSSALTTKREEHGYILLVASAERRRAETSASRDVFTRVRN